MSIIFDALKKAQAKLKSAPAKKAQDEKSKDKTTAPAEKTVYGFGINEDLTQPVKPIPGSKLLETEKDDSAKIPSRPIKGSRRDWTIYNVWEMNTLPLVALILVGIIGIGLVFYTFSIKMKDKYQIKISKEDKVKPAKKEASAAKVQENIKPATPAPKKNIFVLSPGKSLSLDGIVSLDGKNMALIDDQIVEVGDTIKGAKVIAITTNEVVLSLEGKEINMTFK